ncbi:MAG: hypothetical protein M1481_01295 [Candidatus Thermoplasmatota archaeon]|nr:hypothetical protein [Candidatus Thermoplasmatota archaeon]MCL5963461.1 hypothetical protein [Candidatus Thermoplasmatota archaeon]
MYTIVDKKEESKNRINASVVELICPECKSKNIVKDEKKGEFVCQNCGLVVFENMINQERGYVNINDKNEAIGFGDFFTSSIGVDTSTEIGRDMRDIQGNKLTNDIIYKFNNLRRLNKRIRNAKGIERNISMAMIEINRLSSVMSLSKEVREETINIYRKALKSNITHGKKITSLVAASVYAATRLRNVPRTIKEISQYSKSSKLEITRAYATISHGLKLKIPLLTLDDFVIRFSDDLNLVGDARKKIYEYVSIVNSEYHVSSVLPNGLLATIIYITCLELGIERSQDQIAKVANVTPVTIRNHFNELTKIIYSDKR